MTTATIELAMREGTEPVSVTGDLVAGYFLIHEDPRKTTVQPWRVTHRPTGKRIPGEFWTSTGAADFARQVASIEGIDWSSSVGPLPVGKPFLEMRTAAEAADQSAWCGAPLPKWPADESEATADAMARLYATEAKRANYRLSAASEEYFAVERGTPGYAELARKYATAVGVYTSEWAVTRLLRALIEHAPEHADEIARDVWSALESADSLDEWLWEWLIVDYRIDPAAVDADAGKREKAAKQRATEMERGS